MIRYEYEPDWIYMTSGASTDGVPCGESMGNVAPGKAKVCERRSLSENETALAKTTYHCGNEGQYCASQGSKDQPYFIKFGTDDNWIMLPVMGWQGGKVYCG